MKIIDFGIHYFRSIENILIKFPENKPLILFGPNNAGKSNILTALNIALGESYPTYKDMDESDYYFRDKATYPNIEFYCNFDGPYYTDRYNHTCNDITITYNYDGRDHDNIIRNGTNKLFVSKEQRAQCQAIYLDAVRNIGNSLSYSSKYSLLSKFSTQIHSHLKQEKKEQLNELFEQIKCLFNETEEFQTFFERFKSSVNETVKGFVHTLDVDFSGYDPNNYTKSLRIVGKEGPIVRSFEELGTGEQQVLLMAFAKAYMETFNNESFVLIIEEPEAHLHPIAQRWLKKYILDMCKTGIQVVISTHSPEFIDANCLDGLVKVYKENGVTKICQINKEDLYEFCINTGVPSSKLTKDNILDFYSASLSIEQLKGLFAQKIILVEGDTELFSLPYYFDRAGFNLDSNGVEIIKCDGKTGIAKYYRFFKNYGYQCYCLFDADNYNSTDKPNEELSTLLGISHIDNSPDAFNIGAEYGCFGVDFETYMRNTISTYSQAESDIKSSLLTTSKAIVAKNISRTSLFNPGFITKMIEALK